MGSEIYSAAGIYAGIGNTTSGPRAIRGRQKAAPGFEDAWWVWFDTWVHNSGIEKGEDGSYIFDRYDLAAAYEEFIEYYWNSGMGTPPSLDEWLDWYQSAMSEDGYTFNDHKYTWLPIGNILPLLVFALIYMAFLCLKALRATNSSVEK